MKIIEQKTIGKRGQEACEDGIEINGRFVAVIDGSTSKTSLNVRPGVSNGRYCMTLIKNFISSIPPQTAFHDFCIGVTDAVRLAYKASGINISHFEEHPEDRLTASAVVYSPCRNEVWMIGDCQCIVNGQPYENPKPYEERLAEKRAQYLHDALEHGLQVSEAQIEDVGRAHIIDELRASCTGQNKTFSVIDGFDIYLPGTKVIKIENPVDDIILASDGYPFLCPTLAESEAKLAEQLHHDPLCISRFKATKGLMRGCVSFDDRSYVRLTPSNGVESDVDGITFQ